MHKLNPLRTALVLFVGLFLCGAAAKTDVRLVETQSGVSSSRQAQNNCRSTTDAEIVAAIHEKIKADKRFDDQWRHINVSSRNRIVTIRGWVKNRVQRADLAKHASTTQCVRRVINRLDLRRRIGCPPGMKRCGDTCIGRDEDCNLLQGSLLDTSLPLAGGISRRTRDD